MIGQTLGHYKILDKLGAGGMGEVYRAEDTTLKRQIALKVLPPDLAASQERLERFQREAKTLAALDHPNIVHIHTVEEKEGVHFLTMQLVEGKPLSQLIPKGGMPLEQIFEIAIPLADALATAHEKGVIHRDLKPANIMVTDEGRVKVLDFGLAKLRQATQAAVATELPTEPLTQEGRVVGTMPYMSPEQLEGKDLDARSDIFSLGVVLYEMATGERPFKGDSSASLIAAIMTGSPREADGLRAELPHHLARIIRHCLEKEPKRRFQSALDVRNELEDLKAESASGEVWRKSAPAPTRRRFRLWTGLSVAATLLVVGLAITYWVLRSDREPDEAPEAARIGRYSKLTFNPSRESEPSLSPDGRFFAYVSDAAGNLDIYLQRVGGGKAINLTEDSHADYQPAFSPDGESIAFRSEREGGGLFVMGATGESVRRVADRGFFPDWSPDGTTLVFSTLGRTGRWVGNIDSRIWTGIQSTGDLEMVLDRSALMPAWSPNGWRVAYYGVWEPSQGESQHDIFTVPADGGEPVPVTADIHFEDYPAWSQDGRQLYFVSDRGGSRDLWRVPIDERTGQILGSPAPLTSGTKVDRFSLSRDGDRILYASAHETFQILRVPFDPVAERVVGPPVPITEPGLQALHPSVSPDGEWIAFDADFGQPGCKAIGVIRTDGSDLRQLTDGKYRDRYPEWSPDGQRLAFFGNRSGSSQAWIINADGSGLRQLTDMPGQEFPPPVWSPDGSQVALTELNNESTYLFHIDRLLSEEPLEELPPFGESDSKIAAFSWSPDGTGLVFEAGDRETRREVGIVLYSFESGSYQTLTDFGGSPKCLSDGQRILFNDWVDNDRRFFIINSATGDYHEVFSGESLSITPPHRIALGHALAPDNRSIYIERVHSEADIWMLTLEEQE